MQSVYGYCAGLFDSVYSHCAGHFSSVIDIGQVFLSQCIVRHRSCPFSLASSQTKLNAKTCSSQLCSAAFWGTEVRYNFGHTWENVWNVV